MLSTSLKHPLPFRIGGAFATAPARLLAALRRSPTFRALAADPLLAWLTALLAAAALAPVVVCPFLPFADLPNNASAASLLWDAALGQGAAGRYYRVNAQPIPYWTAYAFMAVVARFFGTAVGARAICGLLVVLLPLAVMRLLIALRRSPRLGLWAFAIAWEHNMYAGWVTFLLGMALALVALAWLLEAETPRDALRVAAMSALVALTHAQAVAFLGLAVAAAAIARRPLGRALLLHAIGLSGLCVAIAPWLYERLQAAGPGGAASASSFEWHSAVTKLDKLFFYTLSNVPGTFGEAACAAAFLLLTFGVAALAALAPPARAVLAPRAGAFAVLFASAALYFAAPWAISGPVSHWYTYPRYAPYMLVGLLLLPNVRLDKRHAWALAPGVLAALAVELAVARQMAQFSREVRRLRDVIAAAKPAPQQCKLLPLINTNRLPLTVEDPFNQMSAYVSGELGCFNPYLFDYHTSPLQFRQEGRPPGGISMHPWLFSMERYGQYYDYIFVQGYGQDPVKEGRSPTGHDVRLVKQVGRFKLYAVERAADGPATNRP